jgi:hypothetical protein
MQDLVEVEKCIRTMYHTADGATCQALLTMEFQSWRNNVMRQLLCTSKQEDAHTHAKDVNFEDAELLCLNPESVQAFLCGLKIVYANNVCVISQLLPAVCEELHKQHCSTIDMEARQENCTSVFKKHKTCRSPRQV